MVMKHPKYEEDYYGWIQSTALLLKAGKFHEVDMDHVIEEVEEMARSERHQLVNRLAVLIAHLLKWQLQPDFRCRSWEGSIDEQRKKIKRLVSDNPSLRPLLSRFIEDGYEDSRAIIKKETPIDLKLIPKECPYTFEQCLDDHFFPGGKEDAR